MKRKTNKPLPFAAKLSSFKPLGVDLGTLQSDFTAANKAKKLAVTKLQNAQDAFDLACQRQTSASEKLKAASRAVLAEV
jgi:hypothetical protein